MNFSRLFKLFSVAGGLALVLMAFNNCAGSGSGFSMGYCTNNCASASSANGPSIFITTQSATMTKNLSIAALVVFRQQLQISGVCNTGGAAANNITYAVSQSGAAILTDLYGTAYATKSTVCDNGRYTIILTPPNDAANNPSVISNQSPSSMFQLTTQINTGPNLSSLTPGPKFVTNFFVAY